MPAHGSIPLVSICMPTYNAAEYLHDAIASALAQTFSDFELLIVDNCSTDNTLEIVAEFARSDSRIRVVRNPSNVGLVGNFNRCLIGARGEWVKFLLADDLLTHTCVEGLLERAESDHVPFVICYRDFIAAPETSEPLRKSYLQHAGLVAEWLGGRTFNAEEFAARMATLPLCNPIGEPNC